MVDMAVVAGAGGFIGSHLSRFLKKSGFKVVGLGRRHVDDFDGDFRTVDLTDPSSTQTALSNLKPQWIFNLTGTIDHTLDWPEQRHILYQHFLTVINLVEALDDSNLEAFVNVGSSDEYGHQPPPQHEDLRECPIAPYSAAKVAAAHYLAMLHRRTGFPSVTARLFLVYGPRQDARRLIPMVTEKLINNETVAVTEGLQKRDFLFVADAVKGLIELAKNEKSRGEIFNVASGKPVEIKTILNGIRRHVRKGRVQFGAIPMREGEPKELYADISKITRLTTWHPETPLEEGLERTVQYYVDLHGSKRS